MVSMAMEVKMKKKMLNYGSPWRVYVLEKYICTKSSLLKSWLKRSQCSRVTLGYALIHNPSHVNRVGVGRLVACWIKVHTNLSMFINIYRDALFNIEWRK